MLPHTTFVAADERTLVIRIGIAADTADLLLIAIVFALCLRWRRRRLEGLLRGLGFGRLGGLGKRRRR